MELDVPNLKLVSYGTLIPEEFKSNNKLHKLYKYLKRYYSELGL